MTTRSTRTLTLAAALCLLAAACGGGDDGGTNASALDLPDEQDFQAHERAVQDALRDCMADEGFEYVPIDPSSMHVQLAGPGDRPPADFREKYGYGISTMIGEEPPDGKVEGDDDPNAAIRDALSEEDLAAYNRALYGDMASAMGDGSEVRIHIGPDGAVSGGGSEGEMVSPEDTGCFGTAQESVQGDGAFDPEVGRAFMEVEDRVRTDARMVEATAAWSSCMRDAGFDYESPRDIHEDIEQRLEALRGPDDAEGNPTGDEAGLARLQDEERATAKADDECWEEHLQDVEEKVRAEYEQEVLGDHPELAGD